MKERHRKGDVSIYIYERLMTETGNKVNFVFAALPFIHLFTCDPTVYRFGCLEIFI